MLVECTDIFNYLQLEKSFALCIGLKLSKVYVEAYKYFECGFVNCLGSKAIGNKFVTVKGIRLNISARL